MQLDNIESIYPLSPMQESMLFYAQSRVLAKASGEQSEALTKDVLFNQTQININGDINLEAFKASWQQIINDNSAFRTGFLWEGLQQTQQYVRKSVDLPFQYHDLSKLNESEQQTSIDTILEQDSKQGFDLSKAPLIRVKLCTFDENKHRLIWSSHHLIIDRWCIPLIFKRFSECYDALTQGQNPPPLKPSPYKRYIAWRIKQAPANSNLFWQQILAGFSSSSRLCHFEKDAPACTSEHIIEPESFKLLKNYCQQHKVTVAVAFQSLWALALNQVLKKQDVVFGLVVSGRPAQIKDVENIIGTFVNNIPVRMLLKSEMKLVDFLKFNQSQAYKRFEYEHESSIKLHEFTDLSADEALFDHVLVWQNPTPLNNSQFLNLEAIEGQLNTAYPLTLSIEEREQSLHLLAQVQESWKFLKRDTLFQTLDSIIQQTVQQNSNLMLSELNNFYTDENFQTQTEQAPAQASQIALNSITSAMQSGRVSTGRTILSQDMMHEFLTREWKSILELDEIGLDDDFFELGGSSIKAAQLVSRVEQAEAKQIPIIRLFEGRTIRTMARVYLENDWSIKPHWVTPVNKKGKGKPLFLIASPEVNTIGYAQLARELGQDVSVYIVQPPPESDSIRQVRTKDMPELCLRFIKEIQQVQPSGPYYIMGMCSGAHIGAEIVRQMEKQSIEVAFFGVINTWSLYTISKLYHFEKVADLYRMLRYYARRLKNLQWSEIKLRFLPTIKKRISLNRAEQTATNAHNSDEQSNELQSSTLSEQGQPDEEFVSQTPQRQYDETVVPIKEEKWASERPKNAKLISAKVTVFRTQSKPYWRINSRALGWEYLAHNVELIELKENVHDAILREPNITHFAQQIRKSLV